MDKKEIIEKITPAVEALGCFLTEVEVSSANDIEIYIEKTEGEVDWDDCASIDRTFHELYDQDAEDYSLTVSSAGLDRPFKVLPQYLKAVGSLVDVKFRGGRRVVATLAAAAEDSVTLEYVALETVEGKKKKERVNHCDIFALSDINSVTPYIEFK